MGVMFVQENLKREYMEKLLRQFRKAFGLAFFDDKETMKMLFKKWVSMQSVKADAYVNFLESKALINFSNLGLIAEVGMGNIDTVSYAIKKASGNVVVVSPYADLFDNFKVKSYRGKPGVFKSSGLFALDYDGDLGKFPNVNRYFDDHVDTIITHIPTKLELEMYKLLPPNKNLIIGTFGELADYNKDENIERIIECEQTLKGYKQKKKVHYSISDNNYFVALVMEAAAHEDIVEFYSRYDSDLELNALLYDKNHRIKKSRENDYNIPADYDGSDLLVNARIYDLNHQKQKMIPKNFTFI